MAQISTLSAIIFILCFTFLPVSAQKGESRLRILFELSSGNKDSIDDLAKNVEGLRKNAENLADITVFACGNGVLLFHSEQEENAKNLAKMADKGVDFAVCRESLESAGMNESDLVSFARTVKECSKTIEKLEKQGWARIREGESYVSHL